MHPAVKTWVAAALPDQYDTVVEFGSRDINGTLHDQLGECVYVGVDIEEGPNVDVVADARTYTPATPPDVVVCAEVFEHFADWPDIVRNAFTVLRPGGTFIATCAGPGRHPHSAHSEGRMRPDEHYRNVTPDEMGDALEAAGFDPYTVDQAGRDVRCKATKPWT